MKFHAGDLDFNASVAETGEVQSPQTGDVLRTLTIQFRAQKDDIHERALARAQELRSGGLFSIDELDETETEWRVCESTSLYVGSAPWGVNHHLWRIEQVERLACEALRLGGLELVPYEYVEELGEDGGIRLAGRAAIGEDELAALARLANPIEIVRVGISDTPRSMRVDYVWGYGREGLGVALVGIEVSAPRVTLRGSTIVDEPAAELLDLLVARGALAAADLDTLRERRHAARHVPNVDAWSL